MTRNTSRSVQVQGYSQVNSRAQFPLELLHFILSIKDVDSDSWRMNKPRPCGETGVALMF